MKHIVTLICAAAVLPSLCGQQLSSYMDFGASFPQVSTASISTNSGGTFVADNLHETIDADPGPGELWLNPGAVNGAFISYINASGQWQWAQFIPTNSLSNVYVECKADEGYVISGGYYGEVDFDPGAGEYLLNSNGSPGLFAASYTATGELQWAVSLTGSGYNTLYDMTIDNNGNVLLGGYFQETLDLDPGSGEWSVTANDSDFFIVKLDSSGNFIWALALGGDMYDYVRWIDTDSQQNVVVSGVHRSVVDMDPGAGELLLSPADEFSESNFMAKYDANGNLLWAHTIGLGTGSGDESELCQVDSDDNVLWAGWYAWNIDFDPGVGEAWVADSDFAEGWFVVKYLPDGTFSWVISGPGGYVQALTTDNEGNLYTHGTISSDTGDLDGSEGVYNTNPDGAHPFFCARYNGDGELNWAFGLYGGEDDWATDIHINGDGQLVVAGLYQEDIDLDPGSGETILTAEPSTWPLFVASYNQGECAAVSMEITSVEDLSCADMTGYIEAQFTTGSEPYQYLWNTSEISAEILPTSSGIYWVTGTDANGCTATRSVLVNGPTTGSGYDLNAHLTAWSFVPGFQTMIALDGLNAGCESTDGTFTLVLDPTVNFVSADPTPDAVVENTLTWNYADLAYGDASITPMIWVFTPADTELGTLLNFTVTMDPVAGDFNAENNSRDYSFEVIGSYDPNIKEVYPAGTGAEGFISNNQLMTYTVHFQNTGSAPAVNVYILDEIDPDLDLSTIQVVGSSHAMTTEVLDNNTLKFNFANIQLPDSTNNEPESHGYVIYTIMQQPDLTPFTEIENTASIYFDFNEPVITNTVLNTIASPDFVPTPTDEQPLQLFPNPTDGTTALLRKTNEQCLVSIYTSEGKLCRQITAVGYQTTLNLEDLPAGMYTIGVNENRVKLVIY